MRLESRGLQWLGRVEVQAQGIAKPLLKGTATIILACCYHIRTQALGVRFSYLSTKIFPGGASGNQ